MTEAIPTIINQANPRPTDAPSVWQEFVYSIGSGSSSVDTFSTAVDALRVDAPRAGVPAPALQSCWSTSVGWHRSSSDVDLDAATVGVDANSDEVDSGNQSGNLVSELFAEVAHDIRAPIAIAKQIVSAVAQKAGNSGALESGEVELLNVADMRLQEANQWAEGILIGRCLETGTPVTIRKRFYPAQWRQVAQPLLESVAARKNIELNWVGWDRSLPRLYLDESQLTRVLLNLVSNAVNSSSAGRRISIRVGVQNSVTQRLILAVEDEGIGVAEHMLNQFNSGFRTRTAGDTLGTGLGLRTVHSLITANGGDATMTHAPGGGTLVRITLPSDNPASLIRSWIVDNAPLLEDGNIRSRPELRMYAVRISGMDAELSDVQLQQNAELSSWVYRVGHDRWIWLSVERDCLDAAGPKDLQRALKQLESLRHPRHPYSASVHMAYSLKNFLKVSGASRQLNRRRISELTEILSAQVNRLTGERIPSVDNIQGRNTRMIFRGESGTRQVRQDEASSTPLPKLLRRPRRRDDQPRELRESIGSQSSDAPAVEGSTLLHRRDEAAPAPIRPVRTNASPQPALAGAPIVEQSDPDGDAGNSLSTSTIVAAAAPTATIQPAVAPSTAPQATPAALLAGIPEGIQVREGTPSPSWTALATQFRVDQATIQHAHKPMVGE